MSARLVVAFALAACGGATATAPSTPPAPTVEDRCAPAYASYEQHWGAALAQDLADVDLAPADAQEIVTSQTATLPDHDELAKLRTVHGVIGLFVPDAPWPAAFAAAEVAIEHCGEAAHRPS